MVSFETERKIEDLNPFFTKKAALF